ncbi:MAG: sodium:solute symporter family transporter [Terracidiphilus sp.]
MPNLAAADWLILLIFVFFMLMAGFSLKPAIASSADYLQAGRKLPGWLCGLAFAAAGLGLQAPVALAAAGARYGFQAVPFAILGGILPMLFLALFLMPLYHGSKARTLPEFLALRFDRKTRALAACLFLLSAVAGTALSLFVMARAFAALHIFDVSLHSASLGAGGAFAVILAMPTALVLVIVLSGGLGSSIYSQAMQLFLVAAGFLPAVLLGLKQIGWDGLKAAAASADSTIARDLNGGSASGVPGFLLAAGLGLVFGAVFWCADFRVLQAPMAASNVPSARRAVLVAAALWLLLPLLLILPGIVALALPTPRTTISVRSENGAILHEITVVPPAVEQGQGLVPAMMDPSSGKPLRRADGRNLLDDPLAAPNVLVNYLPMGLLGLGITALLACLMSGISAGATAFSSVFACDLYQAFVAKDASDKRLLLVGRIAAASALLLAFGAAWAAFAWNWNLESLAVALASINAPLLAAILLGVFWKRATGHGAFAGIAAGFAVTLAPSAILLFAGPSAGARSAFIAALTQLHGRNGLAFGFWTIVAGFAVCFVVAAAVSAFTWPRPEGELNGLVYPLAERKPSKKSSSERPELIAAAILLAAIALSLIFL